MRIIFKLLLALIALMICSAMYSLVPTYGLFMAVIVWSIYGCNWRNAYNFTCNHGDYYDCKMEIKLGRLVL